MVDALNQRAVGIDVGGTHVRWAVVNARGRMGARRRQATSPCRAPEDFVRPILRGIAGVINESATGLAPGAGPMIAVGLALPGLIDPQRGCLVRSVNFPFLEEFPIRSAVAQATGYPVELMTDAAAATWGEYRALKPPSPDLAHLRLGTGVACGVVRRGELLPLDAGRIRHLEVLVVEHGTEAMPCRCGLRGCLETIASGRALEEQWSTAHGAGGLYGLREALLRNDSEARRIIERACGGLHRAIAQVAREFGMALVNLGGGVLAHFPEIADKVLADMDAGDAIMVRRAVLGDDAGVIGAALRAMRNEP